MDCHKFWYPVEGQAVSHIPDSFLDYPDSLFDLSYGIISTHYIHSRSAKHPLNELLQGMKFSICVHGISCKPPLQVVSENSFEKLNISLEFLPGKWLTPVKLILRLSEIKMVSHSQKQIYCEKHCFIELDQIFGNLDHIPYHWVRFVLGGIDFYCVYIIDLNLLRNINISNN